MIRNSTLQVLPSAIKCTMVPLLVQSMHITQSKYNIILSAKNTISFRSNNMRW